MNTKTILKTSLLAACCWLMTPAMAQTADGETPAEETVCDGLEGALKGLCNSYCEALDCDSDNPYANEKACERVAENFAKHADGESLPCETKGHCPCVASWESGVDGPSLANVGSSYFSQVECIYNDEASNPGTGLAQAFNPLAPNRSYYRYYHNNYEPVCSAGGTGSNHAPPGSGEGFGVDLDACRAYLAARGCDFN
jgi:hypothetical protein